MGRESGNPDKIMTNNYLSVAMCTYNGARYLPEQLESIASQSSLPKELVVCDDGSTDGSIDIIKAFAREAPFKVSLHINSQRLGTTKNFEKAIDSCFGEIIALSDQDDFWSPDKLRLIQSQFCGSSRVGLVFTDAEIVDERLNSLGYRLWESVGFNKAKQSQANRGDLFRVLLKRNYVPGATLAFRTHFKNIILLCKFMKKVLSPCILWIYRKDKVETPDEFLFLSNIRF